MRIKIKTIFIYFCLLIGMLLVMFSCQKKMRLSTGSGISREEVKQNTQQKPVQFNEGAAEQYVKPSGTIPDHPGLWAGKLANDLSYMFLENNLALNQLDLELLIPTHHLKPMVDASTLDFASRILLFRIFADQTDATKFFETGFNNQPDRIIDLSEGCISFKLNINTAYPENIENGIAFLSRFLEPVNFTEEDVVKIVKLIEHSSFQPETEQRPGYEVINQIISVLFEPQNAAIVGAGDLRLRAQLEESLIKNFSGIEKGSSPVKLKSTDDPINRQGFIFKESSELNVFRLEIPFRYQQSMPVSQRDIRKILVRDMIGSMIESRLNNTYRQELDLAPIVTELKVLGTNEYSFSISTLNSDINKLNILIQTLRSELELIRETGFSREEISVAGLLLQKEFKKRLRAKEIISNPGQVKMLRAHKVYNRPLLDPSQWYSYARTVIPLINVKEVNDLFRQTIENQSTSIIFHPVEIKSDEVARKLQDELPLAAYGFSQNYEDLIIYPFFQELKVDELDRVPLINKERLPADGLDKLELANGIEIFMLPNKYHKDEIRCLMFAEGGIDQLAGNSEFDHLTGLSLLDYPKIGLLDRYAGYAGSQGHPLRIDPVLTDRVHGLYGIASPEDLENLLIAFYQIMQGIDEKSLDFLIGHPNVIVPPTKPGITLNNFQIEGAGYSNESGEINTAQLRDLYSRLFEYNGNFKIIFSGNFNPLILTARVQKYLGNLKDSDRSVVQGVQTVNTIKFIPALRPNTFGSNVPGSVVYEIQSALDPMEMNELDFLATILEEKIQRNLAQTDLYHNIIEVKTNHSQKGSNSQIEVKYDCSQEEATQMRNIILSSVEELKTGDFTDGLVSYSTDKFMVEKEQEKNSNHHRILYIKSAIEAENYTYLESVVRSDYTKIDFSRNKVVLLATLFLSDQAPETK
jgi:predicted Zn-dependent peptidase